jgi:hypothetical protein
MHYAFKILRCQKYTHYLPKKDNIWQKADNSIQVILNLLVQYSGREKAKKFSRFPVPLVSGDSTK